MATRGHSGGLALAVPLAVRVFEVVGFDPVIIETVGVGQVEVDVVGAADTAVVVMTPGMGDAVQANKAGRRGLVESRGTPSASRYASAPCSSSAASRPN